MERFNQNQIVGTGPINIGIAITALVVIAVFATYTITNDSKPSTDDRTSSAPTQIEIKNAADLQAAENNLNNLNFDAFDTSELDTATTDLL